MARKLAASADVVAGELQNRERWRNTGSTTPRSSKVNERLIYVTCKGFLPQGRTNTAQRSMKWFR